MATKRRSRTISHKGVAAQAFVEMHTGMPAKSDDDVLIRLATLVHMNVSSGDMNGAVHLLKDALAQARVDARTAYHKFVVGLGQSFAEVLHTPGVLRVERGPFGGKEEVQARQDDHEAIPKT